MHKLLDIAELRREFTRLWTQYEPALLGFCRKSLNPRQRLEGLQQDIVQEVSRRVFQWCVRNDTLPEQFDAFCFATLKSQIIDCARQNVRQPKLVYQSLWELELNEYAGMPVNHSSTTELREFSARELRTLYVRFRSDPRLDRVDLKMLLHKYFGLNQKRSCELLHISRTAFAKRLLRLRRVCKEIVAISLNKHRWLDYLRNVR